MRAGMLRVPSVRRGKSRSANSRADVQFFWRLAERFARLTTARFYTQRVCHVFGKFHVRQQALKNGLAFATLQTFEGRDENFRCGLCCAHTREMLPVFGNMTSGKRAWSH